MAEPPAHPSNFLCLRCLAEIILPSAEYTCPHCGFSSQNSPPSTSSGRALRHLALETELEMTLRPGSRLPQPQVQRLLRRLGGPPFPSGYFNGAEPPTSLLQDDYPTTLPHAARNLRHLQQLLSELFAPSAAPRTRNRRQFMQYVDHMEHILGELNNILGQIPTNLQDVGPPPADSRSILSLPTIPITEEHIGASSECPVCKEDYSLEENVSQLPCGHFFHNDCIVPWLEQHDTCPICRKSLHEQKTDPAELTAMDLVAFSSSPTSSSPGNANTNDN